MIKQHLYRICYFVNKSYHWTDSLYDIRRTLKSEIEFYLAMEVILLKQELKKKK